MNSPPGNGALASSILSWLERITESRSFAYGSLLAIQEKVLWGIWEHRDLTAGDTTGYFVGASRWSDSLHLDPLWSPMYAFFWGSLQWFVSDPYAVTILHRVLIAVAASLLVLAVLRRLLSPGIAWALAVWWAILPVNYDTLYEVHLFALLPQLIAVLVALRWSGPRMRGAVLGILLATTLLMRNELAVAALIWALVWLVYELRKRRQRQASTVGELIRAAGVPVLAVAVLTAAVVLSWPDRGDLRSRSEEKHTLNVCQIYAFGYQQRHDDFTGSPWTGCQGLMERDFNEEEPTFTEAVRANPGAMGEHVLWNLQLAPYAVQLLLFDRISADHSHSPDYTAVTTDSAVAGVGVVAVAIFIAAGLALLWRDRRRWWQEWIAERVWGWLCLGALGLSGLTVMVWQRPRPSYLFALGVLFLALIGISAMAYRDRWPALRWLRAGIPVVALVALIALPPHYGSDYETQQIGRPGRPLHAMVDRLHPRRDELRDGIPLLATYADSACPYIGGELPCTPLTWGPILNQGAGTSEGTLHRQGVEFIYVDQTDLEDRDIAKVVSEVRESGWTTLAAGSGDETWLLLKRPERGSGS